MESLDQIRLETLNRGITRLCHFTPSRNFIHMATSDTPMIYPTSKLVEKMESPYTPCDEKRLDGNLEWVCCSVEYPNVWYMDQVKSREAIFKEYLVLCLNPKYLWSPGTTFFARNAAASPRAKNKTGVHAFGLLFSESVDGAQGRTFSRTMNFLSACPTDNQAEVQVPKAIPFRDVLKVLVPTVERAESESKRVDLAGGDPERIKFVVAPDVFDKYKLTASIRAGIRPTETAWSRE
jgi:hypothetical protein